MNKAGVTILVLTGLAVLTGTALYFPRIIDLFYQSSHYSFPQQVLSSKPSPSGKYVAKILYDKETKNYFFAVEGTDGTQLILDKKFVPPTGYHDPLVNVSWSDTDTAEIVVDHDFGEGNIKFEFKVNTLSFKQKR